MLDNLFHTDPSENTADKGRSVDRSTQYRLLSLRLRSIVAALILLTATSQAFATTVVGTISSHSHGPAVNVFVLIGGQYRYTDVGGRFKIDNVPQGRQHMTIKRGNVILWQGDVQISGAIIMLNKVLP